MSNAEESPAKGGMPRLVAVSVTRCGSTLTWPEGPRCKSCARQRLVTLKTCTSAHGVASKVTPFHASSYVQKQLVAQPSLAGQGNSICALMLYHLASEVLSLLMLLYNVFVSHFEPT